MEREVNGWIAGLTAGEGPILAQAPMAELTHRAFRQLLAELGGCHLYFTEMVNSRIASAMPVERDPYCQPARDDRPCICQLVGNDPSRITEAVKRLEPMGFAGFDINMGCSRAAMVKKGWGTALLNHPRAAAHLVEAVAKTTSLPVSVKLRSMPGHRLPELLALCRALVEAGASALILHPRDPEDGFKRPARWEEIGEVASRLEVPVIGNGDVATPGDAERMVRETGCAGVMIGRAAVVRPWLFYEIRWRRRWPGSPAEVLLRMARLTRELLPEELGAKRFRLFCTWFVRNWPFHHHLARLVRPDSPVEALTHALCREIEGQPVVERPNCLRL